MITSASLGKFLRKNYISLLVSDNKATSGWRLWTDKDTQSLYERLREEIEDTNDPC